VNDDPELAQRLLRIEPDRFTDEIERLAAELGCDVSAADVQAAIDRARRAWMRQDAVRRADETTRYR